MTRRTAPRIYSLSNGRMAAEYGLRNSRSSATTAQAHNRSTASRVDGDGGCDGIGRR